MLLYQRIRQRRRELGYSQEDLAKLLGYRSRSSINKIEMGENDIPQSKIADFARVLDTTPAYLMGWESDDCIERLARKIQSCEKLKCLFKLTEEVHPDEIQRYINVISAIQGENRCEERE